MKVYLVQHGNSLDSDIDTKRPLSKQGRADIEKLGNFLANSKPNIFHIIHSGKLRAQETAEILSKTLQFENTVESHKGLEPMDDVSIFKESLGHYDKDLLVVGHQPFMSRLVSTLLVGDENKTIVSFEPGTLICLENSEGDRWIINFMLRPSLLRDGDI